MGTLVVILVNPPVQILLELFQGGIDLLPEGDGIELVLDGSMEAFTDPVGLRGPGLGSGMIDVLKGQIELVFVVFSGSAILGSPVSQDPKQRDIMFLIKRDYFVIKGIC